ncbi:MAG: hypothetical protein WCC06_06815 [Candidatus Aminicenantales bacterium]
MRRFAWMALCGLLFILLQGCLVGPAVAPPPPKIEVVPRSPGSHYVWIPGYWKWSRNAYVWISGHWIRPRSGMIWVPGHWERRGYRWVWREGHWRRK